MVAGAGGRQRRAGIRRGVQGAIRYGVQGAIIYTASRAPLGAAKQVDDLAVQPHHVQAAFDRRVAVAHEDQVDPRPPDSLVAETPHTKHIMGT